MESPRGLLADPSGALDRRSPGDEPRRLPRTADFSSADFDATSLLTVILSGDGRVLELLQHEDLVPLGTRIRTRLVTEPATREELLELLQHALAKAGNASLMTANSWRHWSTTARATTVCSWSWGASSWPMAWRTKSRSLTRSATSRSISRGVHAPR